MHLNIKSRLPKIYEQTYIARLCNVSGIIRISESKLDKSITNSEILIDNHDLLRSERNRNGGGLVCCIRIDWSYVLKNPFPNEI